MDGKKEKKSITVFHVHLKDKKYHIYTYSDNILTTDYYFGSISAMFDFFKDKKVDLGIKATSMYNLNMDEQTNPIYENAKCRIRKASLITKPKKSKNEKL